MGQFTKHAKSSPSLLWNTEQLGKELSKQSKRKRPLKKGNVRSAKRLKWQQHLRKLPEFNRQVPMAPSRMSLKRVLRGRLPCVCLERRPKTINLECFWDKILRPQRMELCEERRNITITIDTIINGIIVDMLQRPPLMV